MEVIKDWPPVTRVLVVTTAVLSVLIHSHLISHSPWVFESSQVFRLPPKLPEIWRCFTSFCISGGGISVILDPYFLYTYSSGLELQSPRFREYGSYFVYIAFVMSIILATAGLLLNASILLKALILSFAYTFAQDNPHSNVSFFFITFEAMYLPYALLFLSAVTGGWQSSLVEVCGLLAAHLYDFLTRIWPTFGGGRNWVPTPAFVKRWFAPATGTAQARSYGMAFAPAARESSQGTSSGWSNSRGPGRRLGGEY